MAQDTLFEAGGIPELSQLVQAVRRTRQEQVLLLDGEPVARVVPLGRPVGNHSSQALVDTSALRQVPESSLDDLLMRSPSATPRSFTDAEIREAVDFGHSEAWHAKHG